MLKRLCAALVVLLASSLADAQTPRGSAPTASNDPSAKVACKISEYFYWGCRLVSETPEGQGVGAAAVRMAACLRASTAGRSTDPEVVLPLLFKGLTPQQVTEAVDCPFDAAEPVDLPGAKPVMTRLPTGDDMARNYPARAVGKSIDGSVIMECEAIQNKYKNCRVLREFPLGYGFGTATLRITDFIALKPMDKENKPVAGRRFRFPVLWVISP